MVTNFINSFFSQQFQFGFKLSWCLISVYPILYVKSTFEFALERKTIFAFSTYSILYFDMSILRFKINFPKSFLFFFSSPISSLVVFVLADFLLKPFLVFVLPNTHHISHQHSCNSAIGLSKFGNLLSWICNITAETTYNSLTDSILFGMFSINNSLLTLNPHSSSA